MSGFSWYAERHESEVFTKKTRLSAAFILLEFSRPQRNHCIHYSRQCGKVDLKTCFIKVMKSWEVFGKYIEWIRVISTFPCVRFAYGGWRCRGYTSLIVTVARLASMIQPCMKGFFVWVQQSS